MIPSPAQVARRRTFRLGRAVWLLAPVVLATAVLAGAAPATRAAAPLLPSSRLPARCSASPATLDPPEYYAFPIVSTRRVPGTGQATGLGLITFVPSPFGLSLAPDGSYVYDLVVASERLAPPREGTYVVWVTTPSLDRVRLVGALDEQGGIRDRVQWNKFLVVVTLESRLDPEATMWRGPIVMRGMSRSGMMHTMAGHGPFETDNCAQYGY